MPISTGMITLKVVNDGAPGAPGTPGTPGSAGTPGYGYTLNIVGGTRGIAYAADGTGPQPATSSAFSVQLLENGSAITPYSYSWTCGGSLSGSSTSATFTPVIASTAVTATASFVQVVVKKSSGSADITTSIPIIITKNADGLTWLADWNTNTTLIKDKMIATPRLFAGTNSGTNGAPMLTGVALGKDVLAGNNTLTGILGYKNNVPIFKLGLDGTFLVSSTGDAGSVTGGTGNGIYFDGSNLSITGKVSIKSGSLGDTDIGTIIQGVSDVTAAQNTANNAQTMANNAKEAADKANNSFKEITLDVEGNTRIRGDLLVEGSITGDKISAGSFTIVNKAENRETFVITKDGDAKINGILQSDLFAEDRSLGYRITPDGNAIFNQATIRGDIMLPNSGMTNYGTTRGNENLLLNTDFSRGTTNWRWLSGVISYGGKLCAYRTNSSTTTEQFIGTVVNNSNVAGKTVTLSFLAAGTPNLMLAEVFILSKKTGSANDWDYSFSTNVLHTQTLTTFSVTYTFPADVQSFYVRFDNNGSDDGTNATLYVTEAKLEFGSEVTPWCLSNEDQLGLVRMWAGSSFELRNTAPFRVLQNGSVYASNTRINGTLFGSLDSGELTISKGSFKIGGDNFELDEYGNIIQTGTTPITVSIDKGQTTLNTDVTFGVNNVNYSKSSNLLKLTGTDFSVTSAQGTVEIRRESGAFGGLNIIGPSQGRHILRGSTASDSLGTLVFDSEGNQGAKGDFSFTRKNYAEKCKVNIDGDLSINEKISSPVQGIQMRSVNFTESGSGKVWQGWGFYAN